jgi:hypothetical protein
MSICVWCGKNPCECGTQGKSPKPNPQPPKPRP